MPLIEDFNMDEIFSERQKDQILNNKRQKLGSENSSVSTDYEDKINPRAKSFIPDPSTISNPEKEILVQQLQERCVQANCNRQSLAILKSSHLESDTVSTRLANLKEMCNFMLINYLTSGSSHQKLKQSEDEFFNQFVAEKHPDLLIDVCDFWLNKLWYQVPQKPESFVENLQKILEYIYHNRNIVVYDSNSFKKWLKFIKFIPQ